MVEIQPERAPQIVRHIFVTQEVHDVLNADEPMFPRASAQILFGRYCAGYFVTVTEQMGVEADVEHMVETDEVWIFCFRLPRPGGRLLGRFVAKDIFVGTVIAERQEIGSNYQVFSQRVIDGWAADAEGLPYLISNELDDYIGHVYRNLDNEED